MVVDGRRDAASAGGLRRRWSTETFIYSSLSASVVVDREQLLSGRRSYRRTGARRSIRCSTGRVPQTPPRWRKRARQVGELQLSNRNTHTTHIPPSLCSGDGPTESSRSNLAPLAPRRRAHQQYILAHSSDVTHLIPVSPRPNPQHRSVRNPAPPSSSSRDKVVPLSGVGSKAKGAAVVRHAGSSPPPGAPDGVRVRVRVRAQTDGLRRSPPLLPRPADPHRRRAHPRLLLPLHPQAHGVAVRRRRLLRRLHPLHPEPRGVPAHRRPLLRRPHPLHPEPQGVPARRHLGLHPLLLLRLPRPRRCRGGGGGDGAPPAHGPLRAAVPGGGQPLPALRLPARRRRARGQRAPPRERRAPRRQQRPRRPLRHARRQPGLRRRPGRPAPAPPPRADAGHAGGSGPAYGASRLPSSSDAAYGASRVPGSSRAAYGASSLPGSSGAAYGASRLPGREARGAAEEHLHPLHGLPQVEQERRQRQASGDEAGERRLAARDRGRGRRQAGGAEGPAGEIHWRAGVRGVQPGHVQDGAVQQVGGGRGVQVRRPVPVRARHRRAPPHHPPPALQDPDLPHDHRRRPLPLRPSLPLPALHHPRRPPPPPLRLTDRQSHSSLTPLISSLSYNKQYHGGKQTKKKYSSTYQNRET